MKVFLSCSGDRSKKTASIYITEPFREFSEYEKILDQILVRI
jgi:hypothetical protein